MHLTLPPISPRTTQAPTRADRHMPWGGREPQAWMVSPRESTYKRLCVDTTAFYRDKFQTERDQIHTMFGEGSDHLKSPRQRALEMLEKNPVEITDILRRQAFISDVFQRKPAPAHEHADVIQVRLCMCTCMCMCTDCTCTRLEDGGTACVTPCNSGATSPLCLLAGGATHNKSRPVAARQSSVEEPWDAKTHLETHLEA